MNGLPLVLLEIKNLADQNADIWKAFDQIETYKEQIPDVFQYNEVLVISDGTESLMGSLSANAERFMALRTIPIGTAIVSALCSLARHGQVLQQVHQFEDGCLLESSLPSDMWSFAGTLYVTLRKTQSGTSVDCATHIEGQLFDWGKSNRCIDELFADIQSTPA